MAERYYYFDCLDGIIGDKYLTASEVNELVNGKAEPLEEKQIIKIAQNYEATLYACKKDSSGQFTNQSCLYDCMY